MSFDGRTVKVGSDIGGTFTDIALEVGGELLSTKVLTTHRAPEQGVLTGVDRVLARAGIHWHNIDLFVHGTTLVTNALIERRGARTALLTSQGFRDTIEMRTENRFEQYDLNIVLQRPLVEREDRYVAAGRISAAGEELQALDEEAIATFARSIAEKGYESVAVGFIHSYLVPEHERRARDIILTHAPQVSVSLSCEVSPQMREFERFNTVCANAYVKPLVSAYLARLVVEVAGRGLTAPVFLVHSGGGLISADTAMAFPVRLLESGPAGGAIFASNIAARNSRKKVLSFDMGGTTAKVCLLDDYRPQTARTFEVARTYRFKKGSGMPISIPVIEMVEIGAGGGSIASIDAMQQIRVGPTSAGSEPGPACYGRGGEQPTVTDADLMLGKLDPDSFAGGDIQLSASASKAALETQLGSKVGMSALASAVGVSEMVDENMANAARVHAAESGRELASFSMVAFGGAAPLHAARLCEKLGISELIVPPGAGVGSAIGFLRAPFSYEAVRGVYFSLNALDADRMTSILAELKDEAESVVRQGQPTGDLVCQAKAYMRFKGQGWEIPVMLEPREFGADDAEIVRDEFIREYVRMFGRSLEDIDVEILSLCVLVSTLNTEVEISAAADTIAGAVPSGTREIYDGVEGKTVMAALHDRQSLRAGDRVCGPAVIVEPETTTIVTSSFDAVMHPDGCLILNRKA